ncbi:helicase associated domain-containing protein, partial [Streptomyces sp. LS1784]|uniref:helicase associated domain-containing protein n=1 Tax=Streptomyces sp. LS1784 TaxID=2851533 RepID=UPI001CCF691C
PRAVEWQRMHAVAAVFHVQHGHLDPTDRTKHAELISWLARQRHLGGQGLVDAARVSGLDAFGMTWSKLANAWERYRPQRLNSRNAVMRVHPALMVSLSGRSTGVGECCLLAGERAPVPVRGCGCL